MEIAIEAHDFTVEPELRAWLENRLEILSSRFGPIETARVVIRQGGVAEPWAVTVVIGAFEGHLTPSTVADDLEVAIDEVLVAAASRLRGMKWKTYGIAASCRWCGGEEFLHMRHPHGAALANENGQMRGRLEALVCRGCGHVEWFASDPGRIPTKTDEVTILRARPAPDPYRG